MGKQKTAKLQTEQRTVRDFVTEVGMKDLMEEVNVGDRMVRRAARDGLMPPRWRGGCDKLAEQKGIAPPGPDLFRYSR